MRLGDMFYHRYRTDKHAIPITENFSATISNESQDIEAAVNDDLKQAQQLKNADNTTGAIQEIKDVVSRLSSARQGCKVFRGFQIVKSNKITIPI